MLQRFNRDDIAPVERLFRWDALSNMASMDIVRKAPILLIVIPAIYHLLPSKTYLELNLPWLSHAVVLDIRMPYSLKLVYLAVFSYTIGSIIYQIRAPKILGAAEADPRDREQLIMQNLRQIALELPEIHSTFFFHHFLEAYATNYQKLRELSDAELEKAREFPTFTGLQRLLPMSSRDKMNKDTLWYFAREMRIDESKYHKAEETNAWWINYARAGSRYTCGMAFYFALLLSIVLVLKGAFWIFL